MNLTEFDDADTTLVMNMIINDHPFVLLFIQYFLFYFEHNIFNAERLLRKVDSLVFEFQFSLFPSLNIYFILFTFHFMLFLCVL